MGWLYCITVGHWSWRSPAVLRALVDAATDLGKMLHGVFGGIWQESYAAEATSLFAAKTSQLGHLSLRSSGARFRHFSASLGSPGTSFGSFGAVLGSFGAVLGCFPCRALFLSALISRQPVGRNSSLAIRNVVESREIEHRMHRSKQAVAQAWRSHEPVLTSAAFRVGYGYRGLKFNERPEAADPHAEAPSKCGTLAVSGRLLVLFIHSRGEICAGCHPMQPIYP